MLDVRVASPDDAARLEAFLEPRRDTSMFLRSNLRRGGLVDRGEAFQGTYAIAAGEAGQVAGVVAHGWNGMAIVQAPEHAEALARLAVERSGRPVAGFSGPPDQVARARAALGLSAAPGSLDADEALYALDLAEIAVPPALASGAIEARRPREDELDLLTAWRVAYAAETLGIPDSPAARASAAEVIQRCHRLGAAWVAVEGGRPVAFTATTAELPDMLQIGGVYTPPELRRRGHARAAIAAQLLDARARGLTRAVLFTAETNRAGQKAYEALGFRRVGRYALVIFASPAMVSSRPHARGL